MVPASVAALASLLICAAMIRLGPAFGFVDRPDGYLKSHEAPAVPLGGVGVFAALHLGMAAGGHFDPGFLAATGIVFVLGLVDDRIGLSPMLRLAVQTLAGVLLAVWGEIASVGGVSGVVLVVVLVVVAINAVNLFDGLDGLVGGSTIVAAIGFAVLAVSRGLDGGFGLVLAAAVAGFLVWNWHPAKVFLGDNGSYVIAVALVYASLVSSPPLSEFEVIAASALLGVFIVDLAVTLLRRRLAGLALFEGDRSHVYDQLVDRGMNIPQVALTAAAAQAILAALVVGFDTWTSAVITIPVMTGILIAIIGMLDRFGFLRGT